MSPISRMEGRRRLARISRIEKRSGSARILQIGADADLGGTRVGRRCEFSQTGPIRRDADSRRSRRVQRDEDSRQIVVSADFDGSSSGMRDGRAAALPSAKLRLDPDAVSRSLKISIDAGPARTRGDPCRFASRSKGRRYDDGRSRPFDGQLGVRLEVLRAVGERSSDPPPRSLADHRARRWAIMTSARSSLNPFHEPGVRHRRGRAGFRTCSQDSATPTPRFV